MFHPGFAPVSTIPALPAAAAKKPAVMTEKMRAAIEKEKYGPVLCNLDFLIVKFITFESF